MSTFIDVSLSLGYIDAKAGSVANNENDDLLRCSLLAACPMCLGLCILAHAAMMLALACLFVGIWGYKKLRHLESNLRNRLQ